MKTITVPIPSLVFCLIMPLCLPLAAAPKPAVQAQNANPVYRYDLPRYTVTAQVTYPNDNSGTQLIIYDRGDHNKLIRSYATWMDTKYIDSVSAWHSPEQEIDHVTGVMISYGFSTGSGEGYFILREVGPRNWKLVFAGYSDDGFHHDPEFVDINGDTYPEIILTTHYRRMGEDEDTSVLTSQVWKWSGEKLKYVLLRTVPYNQRLRNFRPVRAGHRK
jgi:hypothetical protein